jgi:hypothetical protein
MSDDRMNQIDEKLALPDIQTQSLGAPPPSTSCTNEMKRDKTLMTKTTDSSHPVSRTLTPTSLPHSLRMM